MARPLPRRRRRSCRDGVLLTPLKALVLTAGIGARLDPLTRLVAKPAVPLGDRALIEHVIGWLQRQGISDLVLNLHHRPETIAAVVGDGAHLGVHVRYSWEQPLLGSAGGPRHALPLIDADECLIINGDTLCDFDITPMRATHAASGADVTMAVVPNPAPTHYNGLVLDDEDRIVGIVPRGPAARGTWHFVGVQIARASMFASLPDGVPAETVAGVYREIIAREPGRIRGWRAHTAFVDVGTPADYLRTAAQFGATGADGSVIWRDSVVAPGATLDECVVAGGVHVPAGLVARRAVIVPGGLVRPGDHAQVRGNVALFQF